MLVASFTTGDLWRVALAVFLLAVGLATGYLLLRLSGTIDRLSSLIKGTEESVLPVITKVGGTVDRVNDQLDKVDRITDSAVDAADAADTAVRAVSMAVTKPVQKVSGLAAGISFGAADLKTGRDWRHAVRTGKEAAARREQELSEELREAGSTAGGAGVARPEPGNAFGEPEAGNTAGGAGAARPETGSAFGDPGAGTGA